MRQIKIHEITRVEGHGDVTISIRDGRLEEARFDIVESPRYFEVMLRGRSYADSSWIASRICGICAVAHATASLKATEAAFGMEVSRRTRLLRRLNFGGEVIQSHVLHAYFLAAPDFFGLGSVVPLANTHPDVVKRAFTLKALGNDLCAAVSGRHVHPVSMTVGGFTAPPSERALRLMRERLLNARGDMEETVALFAGLTFPEFTRETEYVSLDSGDFDFTGGVVRSSDGYSFEPIDYLDHIRERVVPGNTAKFVSAKRDAFMVGALARVNNCFAALHPAARDAAGRLGLATPRHNPYMITAAQVVETVHCVEESVSLIEEILDMGTGREDVHVAVKAGRGVGIVEAPRGLLIHDYTYDDKGTMVEANCIIPTGQNAANINADLAALVPGIIKEDDGKIENLVRMLVRAYDPCISCSTHSLSVMIKRLPFPNP